MDLIALVQNPHDPCGGCIFEKQLKCTSIIRLVRMKYGLPSCFLGYVYKESRNQDMRLVHEQLYS
jgi:hypothetical protein